ncbi:recombinase family protein [Azospirillum thermophilum]|uniref:Resolvase n=1 Tax=Azospirillum thermophilum TaxID=2202148 RepID=A0A2S2CTE1_9PROT|nr:recombinase family protein [Azospirillum thermophilum]AWK87650.1 resolvase [Azospirillum thermophilum]
MSTGRFIAYYRVSTEKQGRSGLGLDAQKLAVLQYLNGGALIGEFVEVESGKKADRPELAKALTACRLQGATLIVAKLDRLSRSVSFISSLIDANVDFRAVDMPEANRLVLHIMAAMAQHEREMIAQRTRAALQQAKAQGRRLGNPNLRAPAGVHALGTAAIKNRADRDAADRVEIIRAIQAEGFTSMNAIAGELNRRGITTPRGGRWQATTVSRVLSRIS